ncbi:YidH family protein [Leptothermofonsia sp. ETS-13]|uniref:YidH family protein n=1 Tax=Leptothermofonsia sp. ETS-13 TaxID=3035696 RepID=UPI003BA29277
MVPEPQAFLMVSGIPHLTLLPSLTLPPLMTKEPKIDRQREHQANERTFLAWLRTSISLIGFGVAIARFGIFLQQLHLSLTQQESTTHPFFNSETLGVSLVVFGIGVIAIAAWRYNQVFWQIERGDYQANRLVIWIMTAVVIVLGILSIPLLLWRNKVPQLPTAPNPAFSRNNLNGILRTKNSSLPAGLGNGWSRDGAIPHRNSGRGVRRRSGNWLWHWTKSGLLPQLRQKNYHR